MVAADDDAVAAAAEEEVVDAAAAAAAAAAGQQEWPQAPDKQLAEAAKKSKNNCQRSGISRYGGSKDEGSSSLRGDSNSNCSGSSSSKRRDQAAATGSLRGVPSAPPARASA